jgi:hypothetical protein
MTILRIDGKLFLVKDNPSRVMLALRLRRRYRARRYAAVRVRRAQRNVEAALGSLFSENVQNGRPDLKRAYHALEQALRKIE